MSVKWQKARLEDLAVFQRGFDINKAEQLPGKVPVVSSSGITSYHSEAKVKGPGVTVGRKGTLGTVFYVPCDYWPHSTSLWVKDFKGNNPRYVYYFLKTLGLEQFDVGASNPTLNRNHIHGISIGIPPLPVQKKIASILSAYDDLIENNRRRIAILEEMARKVYRKRFGGKKANGTIADVGAVCDTIGGGTPSTSISEYWEGGTIPWVVPTDVTRNTSLILLDTDRKITQKGLESSSSRMLPARSILMTSRASVGYFAIANFPVCTNQGFISIVPHDENMRYYLLHNLMERVEEIRSNAKGSTFPEISKMRFRSLKINVPSQGALNNFHLIVEPIYNQVQTLAEGNRKLAAARDALLPKLMSRGKSV